MEGQAQAAKRDVELEGLKFDIAERERQEAIDREKNLEKKTKLLI